MGAFSQTDLVAAALCEQHRWAVGCEAVLRNCLRKDGINRAALQTMLITFGVKRTISDNGFMSLAENLPALAKLAKGVLPDWKSIFDETSPSGRFHVEGSKTGTKDGRRTFASGLTKVLWFAGAHTLPMFDSNTSEAVGARGRDKAAQAIDFYKKLEEDDWSVEQAVDVISEAAATVKLDWDFFPERFLDKLLFVKSLMNKEGFESRFLFAASMNRTAYLSTLQRAEAVNLNLLADRLSQKVTCLPKNWALNPCPPNSPSSPSPVSYRSCNPC